MSIRIELTLMQQSALTTILVDWMRQPESTREWIDVVNDETVTIEDLLTLVTRAGGNSITCPRCGMTSYNPRDIAERYCGNCHQFYAEMLQRWIYGILHAEPEPPGDFLRCLAEATVRADPANGVSLNPALLEIMARFPKYQCTCPPKVLIV